MLPHGHWIRTSLIGLSLCTGCASAGKAPPQSPVSPDKEAALKRFLVADRMEKTAAELESREVENVRQAIVGEITGAYVELHLGISWKHQMINQAEALLARHFEKIDVAGTYASAVQEVFRKEFSREELDKLTEILASPLMQRYQDASSKVREAYTKKGSEVIRPGEEKLVDEFRALLVKGLQAKDVRINP